MQNRIFSAITLILHRIAQSRTVLIAGIILLALVVGYPISTIEPQSAYATPPQPLKWGDDAPDFVVGAEWLNTDKPIRLADLKGRIVLLDFWTLCCINCIHTLPDLAVIEARYPGMVVVIGVHTPKFENEKKIASLTKAVQRYEIKHPVMSDADRKLWRAYGIDQWPTLVLIDPNGKYYGKALGEGNLDLVDKNIKALIKEFDAKGSLKKDPIKFKLTDEKAASPLLFPGKVLADAASKRLFIADSTNHRIVITDLDGKKIAVAGSGKEGLKDGAFADAQFSDPQGMALNGDTLYVADRKNHAIRALNLKDETVKLVAGTGQQNRKWFNKPGTTWSARKIGLASPWDLLYHNKHVYIAMAGQNQIWTFDPLRDTVSVYAGTGYENIIDGPFAKANFAQPSGLATDGKHLFSADSETSSIRYLSLIGGNGYVGTIVGKGLFDFGDTNGVGDQVRLQHALGIAYLDGKLYVADTYNSKIKIIDPNRRTCATFAAGAKLFNEPGGLSIAAGKMYVADTNNHRIQVVDMTTKEVSTLQLQGVDPVRRGQTASAVEKK